MEFHLGISDQNILDFRRFNRTSTSSLVVIINYGSFCLMDIKNLMINSLNFENSVSESVKKK